MAAENFLLAFNPDFVEQNVARVTQQLIVSHRCIISKRKARRTGLLQDKEQSLFCFGRVLACGECFAHGDIAPFELVQGLLQLEVFFGAKLR
jgi:hypothetical protein